MQVEVLNNKMEVTFPLSNQVTPIALLQNLSQNPMCASNELRVCFLGNIMSVRIPSRTYPFNSCLEILIPLDKGRHVMVCSNRPKFQPDETELCRSLFAAANPPELVEVNAYSNDSEKKKSNTVEEELSQLGVEVFIPPESDDFEKEWDSVAGYEEVKAAVKQSISLPLLRPDLFQHMSQLTSKSSNNRNVAGVLFTGPPGVGKTTLARIAAHSAMVPLVYLPVESIMSKWYGEAEQRLRKVFDCCRKMTKVVLFLDELDAFAGSRDGTMHESTRRILSVLLRQLDGLDNDSKEKKSNFMVTVGATNRPQDLDSALSSRFNQIIDFPLPSHDERISIIRRYASTLSQEDLDQIAKSTPGMSGRDIVEFCRQSERRWLFQLLKDGSRVSNMSVSELSPPPLNVYLESIQPSRKNTRC